MSANVRERPEMVKKKSEPTRDRIDLRADPAWVARIERQAEKYGISLTAYVKRAITKELMADEKEEAKKPQGE